MTLDDINTFIADFHAADLRACVEIKGFRDGEIRHNVYVMKDVGGKSEIVFSRHVEPSLARVMRAARTWLNGQTNRDADETAPR